MLRANFYGNEAIRAEQSSVGRLHNSFFVAWIALMIGAFRAGTLREFWLFWIFHNPVLFRCDYLNYWCAGRKQPADHFPPDACTSLATCPKDGDRRSAFIDNSLKFV
jgi:hypothetical protein